VEWLLDDVRISVQKLEKARARDMFDELPQPTGPLPAPAKAVAQHAGITVEPPVMGHHVDMTTWDLGFGVVTTWIPVPTNGTLSVPKTPVLHS
jgi:hypothetical protein